MLVDPNLVRGRVEDETDLVFASGPGELRPERIHAVRVKSGIVLSRVLYKGSALLLMPGKGAQEFEHVALNSGRGLEDVIADHEVLTIRPRRIPSCGRGHTAGQPVSRRTFTPCEVDFSCVRQSRMTGPVRGGGLA